MMSIRLSYILYFIFLFSVAALEPLALVIQAEIFQAVIPLLRYLFIILVFGTIILLLFNYFHEASTSILISIFVALTIVSFRVANYPAFANISIFGFLFVVLSLIILTVLLISWALKNKIRPTKSLYLYTLLIGIVSPFIQFVGAEQNKTTVNGAEISYFMKSKPNIYLLNYDSVAPSDVVREYMLIDEIPHESTLLETFDVMDNSISFHVPTKRSLNDVMRIGQSSQPLSYGAFSGNTNSLLSKVLKKNDYKLITGFNGLYFGNKGPYIDEGLFPTKVDIQTSVLCIAQRRFQKVQAGMICEVAFRMYRIKGFKYIYSLLFGNNYGQKFDAWHERLISKIKYTASSTEPTLLYASTYKGIGHTSTSYDHNDLSARTAYKNEFIASSKGFSQQLKAVSEAISQNDPNSILIVFGDHGMYLSRAVDFEDNPEFFVRDRHLIMLALRKGGHACSESVNLDFETAYITPARLLFAIFQCLGKGDIITPVHFDEDETLIPYAFLNN